MNPMLFSLLLKTLNYSTTLVNYASSVLLPSIDDDHKEEESSSESGGGKRCSVVAGCFPKRFLS